MIALTENKVCIANGSKQIEDDDYAFMFLDEIPYVEIEKINNYSGVKFKV